MVKKSKRPEHKVFVGSNASGTPTYMPYKDWRKMAKKMGEI